MQLQPSVRLVWSMDPSHWPTVHVAWPAHDAGSAVQNGRGAGGPLLLLHALSLTPPQQGMSRYSPAWQVPPSEGGDFGQLASEEHPPASSAAASCPASRLSQLGASQFPPSSGQQ